MSENRNGELEKSRESKRRTAHKQARNNNRTLRTLPYTIHNVSHEISLMRNENAIRTVKPKWYANANGMQQLDSDAFSQNNNNKITLNAMENPLICIFFSLAAQEIWWQWITRWCTLQSCFHFSWNTFLFATACPFNMHAKSDLIAVVSFLLFFFLNQKFRYLITASTFSSI